MDTSPDDRAATVAIQRLSLCTQHLERFHTAIRSLLDDIHIAEGNGEAKQQMMKMMLWISGRQHIDGIRNNLRFYIDNADSFLGSDDFDHLDSVKRGEYFDALRKINIDTEKLEEQYRYYSLLGDIEYRERTLEELDGILKRSYHYVAHRKGIGALRQRGLSMHNTRIKNLKQRICYECGIIVKTIGQVLSHPLAKDMSTEKRNEYEEKWKYYQDEFGKMDSD